MAIQTRSPLQLCRPHETQTQQPTAQRRKPAQVLAFVNQKGGTGKTTTAQNLAMCLALHHGKRVLGVDLDPQGNFGHGLLFEPVHTSKTADRLLMVPKANIDEYIIPVRSGVDLIHNSFQKELHESVDRLPLTPDLLRRQLGTAMTRYDYIVTDTPAGLCRSTQVGIDAADQVIFVVSCGVYGLKGMVAAIDWLSNICSRLSKPLPKIKVVINNYDERRRFDREFKREVEHIFGDDLFQTQIRNSTRVVVASAEGRAVVECSPLCPVAHDFLRLSQEILGLSAVAESPVEAFATDLDDDEELLDEIRAVSRAVSLY
jgi:chromosome partitioning protein